MCVCVSHLGHHLKFSWVYQFEISTGKKLKSCRKKIRKSDYPPPHPPSTEKNPFTPLHALYTVLTINVKFSISLGSPCVRFALTVSTWYSTNVIDLGIRNAHSVPAIAIQINTAKHTYKALKWRKKKKKLLKNWQDYMNEFVKCVD